jgi:uncharacterized membrane protein
MDIIIGLVVLVVAVYIVMAVFKLGFWAALIALVVVVICVSAYRKSKSNRSL